MRNDARWPCDEESRHLALRRCVFGRVYSDVFYDGQEIEERSKRFTLRLVALQPHIHLIDGLGMDLMPRRLKNNRVLQHIVTREFHHMQRS